MKREDVHRCWAPANEPWSPWVKPVLFASLDEDAEPKPLAPAPEWLRRSVIEPMLDAAAATNAPAFNPYRGELRLRDTAIVIDLPGETGTLVGVGLIDYGFRPVPLYNAVPAPGAIIDLRPVMSVLVDAAERVAEAVPSGATPAFLLDANRMRFGDAAVPGAFDNRSICRETDFPSAESLWQAGIRRALLIQETGDRPAVDLESVLLAWQRRGITLWRKNADEPTPATPFVLHRRFWLARMVHDVRSSFLRRRPDNTYGELVAPTAGGG